MSRTLSLLLIAIVVVATSKTVSAFAPLSNSPALATQRTSSKSGVSPMTKNMFEEKESSMTLSSTALNLKVKVDPEKSVKGGFNPAAFKGLAYGGSIVVAVFLPVAFLAWSALN